MSTTFPAIELVMEVTILAPLAGALLSLLVARAAVACAATVAVVTAIASAALAARVASDGTVRHAASGWSPPLGIQLRADGFAAVALVAFAVVGALVTVYAIAHFGARAKAPRGFFPLWLFAWTGLNALLLSADAFNLYVTLELTTLSSVALIATSGTRAALSSGLRYLLFALAGSLFYLLGIALLYGAYGVLDLDLLGGAVGRGPFVWTALTLITVGLALKSPVFPLHGWLPGAYANAPAPVSAALSAVVGKASLYVLIRVWLALFPATVGAGPGAVVGVLGAGSVLWGSIVAYRQRRLRLLVAYSSIAQLGYVFLIFPLGGPSARAGGVYLAVSHAFAVAAMFIAAGTIERAVGHDDIDRLHGLAHHLPLTFVALGLAGVSAMGMPPSGGFVAKWLLVRASFESRQWWWAPVILIGGLLSAAYVFRVMRGAFLPAPVEHCAPVSHVTELVALVLALLSIALGLAPRTAVALLERTFAS